MNEQWLSKSLELEAELDTLKTKFEIYKNFFREVAVMTVRHDVIKCTDGNEYASVSPRKLGELMNSIEQDWYVLDKSK